MAVSPDYVLVFNNWEYTFYQRSTHQPLTGTCPPMTGSFTDLFSPLLLDKTPSGAHNDADVNFIVPSSPLACHPAHPEECPGACVNEAYDARATYHDGRFWIMVGARNQLLKQTGKKGCLADPANSPQARRYIFVAVSKTSDPRQGFWEYGLAEHYADWPIFAVNDNHLVLTDAASGSDNPRKVLVYKTSLLKSGSHQNPYLGHAEDSSFADGESTLLPVRQHDEANGYTLLTTFGGNHLTVYAFRDGSGDIAKHWTKRTVTLEEAPSLSMQPVERDSIIYLVHEYPASGTPTRSGIALERIRLSLPDNATKITAGAFLTVRFSDDDHTLVVPGVEVNSDGVAMAWYARYSVGSHHTSPEARYRALYPEERQFRDSALLHAGGAWPAKISDYNEALDLPGGVIDPSDSRDFWIAHAYNETSGTFEAVARVHPGCGPLDECGDHCVSTLSSEKNCGACGNVCPMGEGCLGGKCYRPCKCGVGYDRGGEYCEHVCRAHEQPPGVRPPVHD